MPQHGSGSNGKGVSFDVAIVGAGVVGCAMARQLTLDGANVVVLEKAQDVLDGASKGNSAILHTGFDAPPGSLEQSCIAAGYREYHKVAAKLGLPILKSGALVLAWNNDHAELLPGLIEKAHDNGVADATPLSKDQILHREPHLSGELVSGFEVPGEYLIDAWASAHAYLLQALANGATLLRTTEVMGGQFDGENWTLDTSADRTIRARCIINCAGLYGDIVSRRLIGKAPFTITPRKGQFVVFDKAASKLVSSIILPVPTKKTKGLVLCQTIYGNLLLGPTAEDQKSRDDSSTNGQMLEELIEKGKQMLPDLAHYEITATYAGLRPASEFQDYQISFEASQNYVTVGGIRSTGLSAALGIAQYVSQRLMISDFSNAAIEEPVTPEPDRLSEYHLRDWQTPEHGGIVCHCESVTAREIERVMAGPMPPSTLQGLKRRTRVCMGRCQGFYCLAEVAKLTNDRFDLPIAEQHG